MAAAYSTKLCRNLWSLFSLADPLIYKLFDNESINWNESKFFGDAFQTL